MALRTGFLHLWALRLNSNNDDMIQIAEMLLASGALNEWMICIQIQFTHVDLDVVTMHCETNSVPSN
jgi:hypothetical protein